MMLAAVSILPSKIRFFYTLETLLSESKNADP